ncbi:hypothetical protein [Myxococcus faecalis]|uniref:hypothetical protein n=1 Tax=Myxococcus faecalis TaxID=3115646 RepID=UPI003CF96CE9
MDRSQHGDARGPRAQRGGWRSRRSCPGAAFAGHRSPREVPREGSRSDQSLSRPGLVPLLGWGLVALVGAFCLGTVEIHRGESINVIWRLVASVCVFLVGYRF